MKRILLGLTILALTGCAKNQPTQTSGNQAQANPAVPPVSVCKILTQNQQILRSTAIPVHSTLDPKFQNFIVKFKEGGPHSGSLVPSGNAVRRYQVKGIEAQMIANNSFSLKLVMTEDNRKQFIENLNTQTDVEYVEPDYPIYPIGNQVPSTLSSTLSPSVNSAAITASSVANISSQWALQTVNAPAAWSLTQGSPNIVVAVLDSGIDYTHPDLKDNMWKNPNETVNGLDDDANGYIDDIYGWNFASKNSNPISTTTAPHGSHVAGIIGATGANNTGTYGIAPVVKLMSLKFIGDTGTGSTSNAILGIDYAIQKKVFAINNSWGSTGTSMALQQAVARAEAAGILFVVAAGNGDANGLGVNIDSQPWYPASYTNTNVFPVAASDAQDHLATFSNYGVNQVLVAAPGVSILSTITNFSYELMSGTSMATPLVTGLSVLVKAANPKLTAQQVMTIIENSVDKVPSMAGKILSGGRINALSAVNAALSSAGIICP